MRNHPDGWHKTPRGLRHEQFGEVNRVSPAPGRRLPRWEAIAMDGRVVGYFASERRAKTNLVLAHHGLVDR